MQTKKVLIIGEVFVDHHLDIKDGDVPVSRLGGIFHAARACAALNVDYALAYYAPRYLEKSVNDFGKGELNAKDLCLLGVIDNSPNVMLITNSDESGDQLYDNILCRQAVFFNKESVSDVINRFSPTDIVIFPGRYGNSDILSEINCFKINLHIDMNYDSKDIYDITDFHAKTIILSTSTIIFKHFFEKNSYSDLVDFFKNKNVSTLLIKENRGGSWIYDFCKDRSYEAPAIFMNRIVHSVGVGDVYDISYLFGMNDSETIMNRMKFASWVSVLYAKTLDYNSFQNNIKPILSRSYFLQLDGIRISWFERKKYPIYIAAPDFNYIDTEIIDILEQSLRYHNFLPVRPIKENGQVSETTTAAEEDVIFLKDIKLLDDCKIMIAVLLYNDQGTLTEIGKYHEAGKPIVLFDPYKKLNNMFLKHIVTCYCNTNSQVIDKVFEIIRRMEKDGKQI